MPLFSLHINVSTHLTAEKLKQLDQYLIAIKHGIELGFIGHFYDAQLQNVNPITYIEYSEANVIYVNVDTEVISISESDKNLIIRMVLYWLRNLEIEFTNILPIENHLIAENAQSLSSQRNKMTFQVFDETEYWGYGEQIHVYIEFEQPVQSSTIAFLSKAGMVFESLVPGMSPFSEDECCNIGETALVHLESNVIDYWVESIFALPFEWKRRFEAFLIKNQLEFKIITVRYEQ